MPTSGPALRAKRGILVLDHHGFGNVVMSLPLLNDLCAASGSRAPAPVSILLASPAHYDLLKENGLPLRPLFLPDYRTWRGLLRLRREFKGCFDLVVAVPQVPPRLAFLIKTLLGAREVIGEADGPAAWLLTRHARKTPTKSILESQREMVKLLGLSPTSPPPAIVLTPAEIAWSRSALNQFISGPHRRLLAVHISAEKPVKRWPAERFGEVIAALGRRFPDLTVVSFGTAPEREAANLARRQAEGIPWLEGTGIWSLRQTAAVLQQCRLLISGDTGLMHIAAAVGTRTLAIFGPTSPSRLAPVHAGGDSIGPATPCHPCFERNHGPCPCILEIRPDVVTLKAVQLLNDSLPTAPAA